MKRKKALHTSFYPGPTLSLNLFHFSNPSSSYTYFQNWMIRKFKTTESDIYISAGSAGHAFITAQSGPRARVTHPASSPISTSVRTHLKTFLFLSLSFYYHNMNIITVLLFHYFLYLHIN